MPGNDCKAISVQCPACSSKQNVEVPTHLVQENLKGVSIVAINARCGHSFHIFIDRRFSIRGIQRSDFDVTANAADTGQVQSYSLPGIVKMFGDEPFLLAMRAILLNQKVVLVGSDPQILKSLFINFVSLFERELHDSGDAMEIMSKEEYEHLNPLQSNTNLVIDLDFSVVKGNPNRNGKATIERELLKRYLNIKDVERQRDEFKACISRIFMYASIMLGFLDQGLVSFKEIKSAMLKKGKNIAMDELDLAWTAANSRCTMHLK